MFYLIKPVLIALTVVTLIVWLAHVQVPELRQIQSGESELWCHLHTGWQKIEPENVKGLHTNGKWIFSNGSARSCEVVER